MARSTGSKSKSKQSDLQALVEGGTLTRGEVIEILENLAREGGPSAQIQAIRLLRDMANGDEGPGAGAFDELDARRNRNAA